MKNLQESQVKKMWEEIEKSNLKLNILMAGKTGVGKHLL